MKCDQCQTDVADGARFCRQCGNRLAPDVAQDYATQTVSFVPFMTQTVSFVPHEPAAAAAPAGRLVTGDTLLDDYVVQRELGRGGMGIVYLVRSRATGHEFAAKTAKLIDDDRRRLFLKELYTWLDLPRHPNIVGCRFFRTIGEELVIFAEYVTGGSLAQRIRGKTLSQPETIVDVAIQFAWGLAAAHQAGVIHRDVKPDNVLLAADGTTKVSDFGLSSARTALRQHMPGDLGVTSAGMTVPYRSPEQARCATLTRQTDVWSWGVSVLEIYAGGLRWKRGEEAPAFLEGLAQEPGDRLVTPLPARVLTLLRRCFQPDPRDRWDSLLDAAAELKQVYEEIAGRRYPRTFPDSTMDWRDDADLSRYYQDKGHDAEHWLGAALEATGGNSKLAATFFQGKHHTQAAHLAEQLAGFDEARRIIERAGESAATQRSDLDEQLARLCTDAAFVHRLAGDYGGAIGRHDQAAAICRRRAGGEDLEWTSLTLLAEHDKALTLECAGEYAAARKLFDEAIHRVLSRTQQPRFALMFDSHLVQLYLGKASVCFHLRDFTSTIGLHDRAIAILERIRDFDPQPKVIALLVRAYRDKAVVAAAMDDPASAEKWAAAAAGVRSGAGDSAGLEQADLLMDRARARYDADPQQAIALFRHALAIYEQVVDADKQRLFAPRLAKCYGNLALALARQADHPAALELYERAFARIDEVVSHEGRRELERELVRVALNRAISLREVGRGVEAMSCLDDAIQRVERLRSGRDDVELDHHLALALSDQAYLHTLQRVPRQAAALFERACGLWRRLVHECGRHELRRYLEIAEENRRNLP